MLKKQKQKQPFLTKTEIQHLSTSQHQARPSRARGPDERLTQICTSKHSNEQPGLKLAVNNSAHLLSTKHNTIFFYVVATFLINVVSPAQNHSNATFQLLNPEFLCP